MVRFLTGLFLLGTFLSSQAQGGPGGEAPYGFEWIIPNQDYYRFRLGRDGIYRIYFDELVQAGIPVESIPSEQFRLFALGEEVVLYSSAAGTLQDGDYLEFIGRKNRGELDRLLYPDPSTDPLNPDFSLFTDSLTYFLTWTDRPGAGKRFADESLHAATGMQTIQAEQVEVFGQTLAVRKQGSARLAYRFSTFERGEGFGKLWNGEELILSLPADAQGKLRLTLRWAATTDLTGTEIFLNGTAIQSLPETPILQIQEDTFHLSIGPDTSPIRLRFSPEAERRIFIPRICLQYDIPGKLDQRDSLTFVLKSMPREQVISWADAEADWVFLDEISGSRWQIPSDLDLAGIRFPGSGEDRKIFAATADGGILRVLTLEKTPLLSPREYTGNYLIFSTRDWLGEGRAADQYARYRESSAGGAYQVGRIAVEDLYQTFGYGIDQHPIAFRNLTRYLLAEGRLPEYALLIGKGLTLNLTRDERSELRRRNRVPTFGFPGSDNLLFGDEAHPEGWVPVGRIAAESEAEIRAYLEKVKAYEAGLLGDRTTANHLWRKKAVHLAGGDAGTREHETFKGYLTNVAEEINSNPVGGKALVFGKSEEEPLAQSVSQQVVAELEAGAGIKMYLGHGGVVNTDFGLDDPAFFDLAPRYPLTFSLGCYSGNLFTEVKSLSEQFVLAPGKGSLQYIASTDLASAANLAFFAQTYYQLLGSDFFARGQGELMRAVRQKLLAEGTIGFTAMAQLISFHGDPALKLFAAAGPDYSPDASSFTFLSRNITTQTDSLLFQLTLANLGQQIDTTWLSFQLIHALPNGEQKTYRDSIRFYGSTVSLRRSLPLQDPLPGIHRLNLRLDPDDRIPEFPAPAGASNNDLQRPGSPAGFPFLVQEALAQAAWPADFGIVGEVLDSLIAYAPAGKMVSWELDTSLTFDSPFRQRTRTNSPGTIHAWQPELKREAEKVYYWRVAVEEASQSPAWDLHSFVHLPGEGPGWNQSHFGQFLQTGLPPLRADSASQGFAYPTRQNSVVVQSVARQGNSTRSRILINNERVFNFVSNQPALAIRYLDTLTGRLNGGRSFNLTREDQRSACLEYLRQPPPPGSLTLILSIYIAGSPLDPSVWSSDRENFGETVPEVLGDIGTGLARQMDSTGLDPYLLILDGEQVLAEKIGGAEVFSVSHLFFLDIPETGASIQSRVLGPYRAWTQAIAKIGTGRDSLNLALVSPESSIRIAMESSTPVSLIGVEDIRGRPLQFKLYTRDTLKRTFPGIDYWRIHFQPRPDLAAHRLQPDQDTFFRGEPLDLAFSFFNLTETAVDTVPVQFTFTGPNNEEFLFRDTVFGHPGLSLRTQPLSVPTADWQAGPWQVRASLFAEGKTEEVNPGNNLSEAAFFLKEDQAAPLLRVTFDGRTILHGDLVSARPLIQVRLVDESPYLPLQDTGLFQIQLTWPDGSVRSFGPSDPEYRFTSAEPGKQNRAVVELEPTLEQSGTYTLRVNAEDRSGNPAGRLPYEIQFEVETESRISQLLPYPNPFSNATRFQYTLTGDAPPQDFILQIMTISGEIVREVDEMEFGPMRVGTHLSEFVWDGTDQFGDQLANGVYLYRVLTRDQNGEAFQPYSNPAIDRYFKNGIGKVVILR